MSVKLIQYWNVRHGCQEAFDAFFTRDYVTAVDGTALMRMVGAWHTASGEGPYFLTEGVSDSLEKVEALIMGPVFSDLRRRLGHLVEDYATKLLVPRDAVEDGPAGIASGYKFTQHFNINAAEIYAFDEFFTDVYAQGLVRFGVRLVGHWQVAVGATPYVVVEGCSDALATIGDMLQHPVYQRLTLNLLNMVSGYGCKILVPSGHLNA